MRIGACHGWSGEIINHDGHVYSCRRCTRLGTILSHVKERESCNGIIEGGTIPFFPKI